MTKRNGWRKRWIEMGKNVLIVLLSGSALWILSTYFPLNALSGEEPQTAQGSQAEYVGWKNSIRPLRIVATVSNGEHLLRAGIQYNQSSTDLFFQQNASLLVEALTNVGEPEVRSRWHWQHALQQAPGLLFDFQGELPIAVLLAGLSDAETELDGVVRRVLLTVEQDCVVLYYYDIRTERYYRGECDIITKTQLMAAVSTLNDNGAFYAFESDTYTDLAPDTLITPDTQSQPIVAATYPLSGSRSDLIDVLNDLGFSLSTCSLYSTEEEVARCGSETVRLNRNNVVEYRAGEESSNQFWLSTTNAKSNTGQIIHQVELCRQVVAQLMKNRCGEAQLYLSRVEDTEQGTRICFDYYLNGSVVWLEEGHAAEFLVNAREILSFTVQLRNYTSMEQSGIVLPVLQATAILRTLGLEGRELALIYRDFGEERLTAQWAAAEER